MNLRRVILLGLVGGAVLAGVSRKGTPASTAIPFEQDFRRICGEVWLWRAAQIKAESNFNPNVRSFDGGEGLGQATGKAWPWYISKGWVPKDSTPFQPVPAIMGAHRHMNWATPQVGSMRAGWCAYNAGVPHIQQAIRLATAAGMDTEADEGAFLVMLPQVTHAASRWTINYDRNIRAIHAGYVRAGIK